MHGCTCNAHKDIKRRNWRVIDRNCNYSAFNGYRRAYSKFSKVTCTICGRIWRTSADYVRSLEDK
jgi:hypothetical protein